MTPAERRLISELAAKPAQLDLPPLQSSEALGTDVEYGHSQKANSEARDAYERLISTWLEEAKPGAFFNRDGGNIYKRPHKLFTAHQADNIYQGNSLDDFEIAMSRQGYRAGVFVHRFREMWILLLPAGRVRAKPLDESFKDLIGADSLSAGEVDSLLEVLADHEATPADRLNNVSVIQ